MHFKVKKRFGQNGWALYRWNSTSETPKYVSQDAWPDGLSSKMTIDEARTVVKSLNADTRIKREEAAKASVLAKRRGEERIQSAYLPEDVVSHFERLFINPIQNKRKSADKRTQWKMAQKIIAAGGVDPSDWVLAPDVIYQYLEKHPKSQDYIKRVFQLMNRYGVLYCKKRGLYGFMPLETPPDHWRVKIREAHKREDGHHKKSKKLTLPQLKDLKNVLREDHYSWVLLSFWFGLRPEEVDLIRYPVETRPHNVGWKNWWFEDNNKTLVIWQPKLVNISKEDRYKRIPMFLDEQKQAKELFLSKEIKRPARSALKRFPKGVTLYGGRHGFTSHMERIGQPIQTVSKWLGHRSLSTTERYYRDLGIIAEASVVDKKAS